VIRPARFLPALLLCLLLLPVPVGEVLAQTFPQLTGRIVDDAGLLGSHDREAIRQALEDHEERKSNQLVVVTLPSLQGYEIRDFGYRLGRHWGIGQKDRDNGVLLIVAPEERKVSIEVGYGLEGLLTDSRSKRIIEETILPAFRRGDMSDGIRAGAFAILTVLENSGFGPAEPSMPNRPIYLLYGFIAGFMLLFLFFVRVGISRNGARFLSFSEVQAYWTPEEVAAGVVRGASDITPGSGSKRYGNVVKISFGGGGFSGGGGSFGGGGASGGW
jgi:uncharacterized protein